LDDDEVSKCIRLRRSVRSFKEAEIEEEKLLKILEAAYWAPSAGGLHWIHVILVREREKILEVLSKEGGYIKSDIINAILEDSISSRYLRNANAMIVVATNVLKYKQAYDDAITGGQQEWKDLSFGDLFAINDADLAALNMTLQAHALKLGVCWIGHINGEKIRKLFEIDEKEAVMPVCILLIGYPDDEMEEKTRAIIDRIRNEQETKKPKRATTEKIYKEERFGQRLKALNALKKKIEEVKRLRGNT